MSCSSCSCLPLSLPALCPEQRPQRKTPIRVRVVGVCPSVAQKLAVAQIHDGQTDSKAEFNSIILFLMSSEVLVNSMVKEASPGEGAWETDRWQGLRKKGILTSPQCL